jgi:hemolysin activation/secretion protein
LSAELRYAFPSREGGLPGSLVGALFMDWARGRLDKNPSVSNTVTDRNTRILSGFGVGLNWATAYSWSAQASLAWRVQGDLVNDKLEQRPRAYVQVTYYF